MGFDNAHLYQKINRIRNRGQQRRKDRITDIRLNYSAPLVQVAQEKQVTAIKLQEFKLKNVQRVNRNKRLNYISILLTLMILGFLLYLFFTLLKF